MSLLPPRPPSGWASHVRAELRRLSSGGMREHPLQRLHRLGWMSSVTVALVDGSRPRWFGTDPYVSMEYQNMYYSWERKNIM